MTDPHPLNALRWRKSSYSCEWNCVEMAELPDGDVAIRNSKRPEAVLRFTRGDVKAFLDGAKAGEFDDMA